METSTREMRVPIQPQGPRRAAQDDAAALRADFPQFKIWQEATAPMNPEGRVRYVARRRRDDIRPHTVVTSDLSEMREVLGAHVSDALPGGQNSLLEP